LTKSNTDTENTILSEGFEQVMRTGVRAFTVESLAGSLGMSKKTIYKFFPSKEKLLLRIMQFMTARVRRQFERIITEEDNAARQFIKVMNMIIGVLSQVSVERMQELKVRYPRIWLYVEEFRRERLENFKAILIRGQDQGLVRDDIDVHQIALLYIEIINRVFQPEFFVESGMSIKDTLHVFIKIFSRGIFTDEGLTIIEAAS